MVTTSVIWRTWFPLYKEYDVYLVSNDRSNLDSLPFTIKKHYQIGKNCWVENYDLADTIKKEITEENIENALFLFCAGPFGNILAHQLWSHNKNNTYIDIGSTLKPFSFRRGRKAHKRIS